MRYFPLFESAGVRRGVRRNVSVVATGFFCFLGLVAGTFGTFEALVGGAFVGAFAQEYKQATVDESLASQKSTVLASGDEAQVKDFLRKYYLARWTVIDNEREIHKYRAELEADATSVSGAVQVSFLKAAVHALKSYAASSSCYPACRFNAVYAIGTLNEVAGADRNSPGVPYAGAISTLANFCTSSKEFPDYVRLGALIGLVRHAELGIKDDKNRAGVKTVFARILDSKYQEEKNLRDDVYEWFQEVAMQGLASFKSPEGSKGGVGTLDLFRQIIEDSERSFELRCVAARAIGSMDLTSAQNYDYVGLGKSLVTLARDFCIEESTYIDTEIVRDQVKNAAGSAMGGGMGGMSGGMTGGGMSGGMGSGMSGGMGGMTGGGMGGGTIQNQKSLEAMVARVQYGFDCIQCAVKGSTKGLGIMEKLSDSDQAQKDMKDTLKNLLDEFKSTNEFIEEGPKVSSGMSGMTGGSAGMYGGASGGKGKSAVIMVDASSMKDHLLEKKIKFSELLGINAY